ncbi:MFS transporter [Clostridium intestinale]|uniref:MFS transporter n=1 Tax=Clostridium intestinale TaxID=36845 RepID=A0A7D6ZIJ1_9CLOT|nr:MFS transporter [Clostridium intestinale]QLY81361.1 MFS transporter [Clostridium intestinale]
MNKRLNIYLMYGIIFLQGFVFYGPVAVLYRENRNLSLSNIFLIESISWILVIIFEIPWGWFGDRFGYKKTLIISNLVYLLSKVVFYNAYSFEMFLFERVLLALALSGVSGCDSALIYSSIKEEEGEKVFGRYNASSTAGYLIASLLSPFLIRKSIDSTAFWTMIPYGLALALTLFIKDVEVKHETKPKFKESLSKALKKKNIIILVVSAALIGEVVQAVSVFLNQSQYLKSGIDIKYFGLIGVIVQLVRLSSARGYKLSERLGKNKSIKLLYMLITAGCVLLLFTSNGILTVGSIILICGSYAILSPLILDIENKNIDNIDRATLLSIFSMFGDVVGAGGNVFLGKAADISIEAALGVCIFMCFCGYILFILNLKKLN